MKVIEKYFIATPLGGVTARFSDEGVAKTYAGPHGQVDTLETTYVFASLEEKELFETKAGRFSEEVAFLELGLMLSDKGLKVMNALIQDKGVENVKKFLDKPVAETDMGETLINRFAEAKLETVLAVIKINTENDFLKFRQFGKGALGDLKKWLKKNGLELNMFITG